MAAIVLQVLDGTDRGRVFEHPATPITIGREEGNTFQLNDERVSRYHLKIQEDHEKVILTDLESTNGTKVNGEDIQVRILRFGDLIALGRSVLLFGSKEQIAGRLAGLRSLRSGASRTMSPEAGTGNPQPPALDFDVSAMDADARAVLNTMEPPALPERLSPGQAAQLAEIFEYFQIQVRQLLGTVHVDEKSERVTLDYQRWQALLDMQLRLAGYLKQIAEPNSHVT
ncbi:MAG: FHA domain-containing protein [Planctomycetia bacterium]|nr:FHA domain-containing protein [Planctomycetia bacterium]